MEPITWSVIASLIVQEGLPFAEKIYTNWSSGSLPTAANFTELRELQKQRASDIMKQQLAKAGIPLDDPKAIALLALTN